MIRIVNPLLHTKYLRTDCLRSVFLWWTPQPCITSTERWNTFLQFGNLEKTKHGAVVCYDQNWKYPSFHLAYSDLTSIKKQVPRIESTVLQYQIEPIQLRGVVPSFVNAAFIEFTFQQGVIAASMQRMPGLPGLSERLGLQLH
jgi:hypothetical protein